MGSRRESREAALQLLFSHDIQKPEDLDGPAIESFWALRPASQNVREMSTVILRGVLENLDPIDDKIASACENYSLERISVVDRNILRIALYEMFHREDIPPIVSINEAIEIAKRFGSPDSGAFINGILDRLKEQLTRPLRSAKRDGC